MNLSLGPIQADDEFFLSQEELLELRAREAARRDTQKVADELRDQFTEKLTGLLARQG